MYKAELTLWRMPKYIHIPYSGTIVVSQALTSLGVDRDKVCH